MLAWWALEDDKQDLLSLETVFEIEHIYARNRQEKEGSLKNPKNIELLGNKAILEKKINIRASDYKFSDKVKYYKGFRTAQGKDKEGTKVNELLQFACTKTDFTEKDITTRNKRILDDFVQFMKSNHLIIQ